MQDTLNQIYSSIGAYIPNLLGAVVVLIVGVLIALIISAIVRGVLQRAKLDQKIAGWRDKTEKGESRDVTRGIGKGIFWLIMILVLIAFFQALRLTLVTDPLNRLLNQIFTFLPQLIGAAILLLIAWLIASLLRLIVTRVMRAAKLDQHIGGKVDLEKEKPLQLTKTIGDMVYWLIFLLFLPAILGALNLAGLLEPVQGMLDKFLGFLPNIIAAGVIGMVGWFVARIIRQVVTNLLSAAGSDRLSDRVGIASLSKLVGLVVYILILIPVLIAALNALGMDAITQPASSMLNLILKALPAIFAALMLVMIAYVVGRIVAGFSTELLTGIGFNSILIKLGITKQTVEAKRTLSEIAGFLVMTAIMLFAVFEASNLLGFEALSNLMIELTVLGGRIVLGLVIFGIGLYLANLTSKTILVSASSESNILSLVARVAILVLAGSIAIRYMGLANEIVNLAFGLILGAVAIAVAIAFGIGGRNVAARKLEEWTAGKKEK
jgi:hypothetical protein